MGEGGAAQLLSLRGGHLNRAALGSGDRKVGTSSGSSRSVEVAERRRGKRRSAQGRRGQRRSAQHGEARCDAGRGMQDMFHPQARDALLATDL